MGINNNNNNDIDHDLMEIINSLLSTCSCSEVKEQILLLATQIDDSKYEELAVHYHSVYGGKKVKNNFIFIFRIIITIKIEYKIATIV